MKITLLVIGKSDITFIKEGLDSFSRRLNHYLPFEIKEIAAIKSKGKMSTAQQKQKERELILRHTDPSDHLILLEEKAKAYSWVAFASFLQGVMNRGLKHVVFIVGGPFGFDHALKQEAAALVSLSPMTFSHQLIRLIFAEQLYRAMTILNNEPYHNE